MSGFDRDNGAHGADGRVGARWSAAEALEWLSTPDARAHKLNRGVLGARVGSARFPGAAVLGVSAAWRTGIGMVRYVPPLGDDASDMGLPSPAAAVLAARPETVFGDGACDAWVLGSGTDAAARSFEEREALARLQLGAAPLVVDAGALESALARTSKSAPAVLTPHRGEFSRLWAAAGFDASEHDAEPDHTDVCHLASRLSATILLKGSTSLVVSPGGRVLAVGPATPWLATAGTGDVLAGVLGALVARHAAAVRSNPELLAPLAATAALVHDAAARLASGDDAKSPAACTGSPITALDVANAVPRAIRQLRES